MLTAFTWLGEGFDTLNNIVLKNYHTVGLSTLIQGWGGVKAALAPLYSVAFYSEPTMSNISDIFKKHHKLGKPVPKFDIAMWNQKKFICRKLFIWWNMAQVF